MGDHGGGARQIPALKTTRRCRVDVLYPPQYTSAVDPTTDVSRMAGLVVLAVVPPDELRATGADGMESALSRLGGQMPRAPVAVFLGQPPERFDGDLLRVAARMRPHTLFIGASPTRALLRQELDYPSRTAHVLYTWFERHTRLELRGSVAEELLRAGLQAGPGTALPSNGSGRVASSTGLRARDWFDLGRALRSASHLHRHEGHSLPRTAISLGFHDVSSLSRHLVRIFGHRPAFLRPRLGWEWLVHDWVLRKAPTALQRPVSRVTPEGFTLCLREAKSGGRSA